MTAEICGFIDDGYTEQGFIKGKPGMYPDLSFEFRPMLITEQAQCRKEWDKLEKAGDPEGQRKLYARWIDKQVLSWDVKKRGGGPVDKTVENILKLKDEWFFRLFHIVSLSEVSDELPEGSKPVDLLETAKN